MCVCTRKSLDAASAKVLAKPRFDTAALRARAGEAVFARGVAYADEKRVKLLTVQPNRVRAQVHGSETYAVALDGAGSAFSGDCDCPAFEDWGFCKHLVATALIVNAASPEQLAGSVAASDRVRAHLCGGGLDALVDRLMLLAEKYQGLWRELEIEAAIAGEEDEPLLARLCAAIDEATDTGHGVDWRGAATWADEVRPLVGQIGELVASGRGALALQVLDHLFEGLEEAFEDIDDSDGEAMSVYREAGEAHLRACISAKIEPTLLAARLFELETASPYDIWTGAHETYGEVLGPAGLAEYRRLALAAWTGAGGKGDEGPDRGARSTVRCILDSFARQEGDLDARIALRADDVSSAWGYLEIAQLCAEGGRQADALKWAQEGVWKFEDRPDQSLTVFTADLLRRAGKEGKADDLLWAVFERNPNLQLLRLLREAADDPATAIDRGASAVEARLAKQRPQSWSVLPDLLVDILLEGARFDEAWSAAFAHRCGERALEGLAHATEQTHPEEALKAYGDLVERGLRTTTQEGYRRACTIIARMGRLRANLGQGAAQTAYVAELAARHKAKRNFIKLLGHG